MANQLYTKEHLDKRNVYPKNYTENIFDKESGKALPDILNSFNCYFLSYFGDKESTSILAICSHSFFSNTFSSFLNSNLLA